MPPGMHVANRHARLSTVPDLRALDVAADAVTRAADEQALCDAALRTVVPLLGLSFGGVVIWGPAGRACAATGLSQLALLTVERWVRDDASSGPVVIDLASSAAPEGVRGRPGMMCIAPVLVRGAPRGAIAAGRERPRGFGDEELAVLAAVAARTAQAVERIEAERAVRAERDLYTQGPMVVLTWRAGPGWPVEYVSPNVERVLGYRACDLLSGAVPFASIIHAEDRDRVGAETAQAHAHGSATALSRYRLTRADGTVVAVADTTRIVRDAAGRVTHHHGYLVVEDAPAPQSGARAAPEHKAESEGARRLAACIANDFNEALAAIAGHASLAAGRLAPATPERAAVDQVLRDVEGWSATVRALLAYAGRQVVVPRMLDLGTVVQRAGAMLEAAARPPTEIRTSVPADLWPVRADPSQIEHALLALVSNAQEAMPEGGVITISGSNTSVTAAGEVTPGEYAVLCVRDTGRGIDAGVRPHLFEPFFTTKAPGAGRGLGLAAVDGIMRQWGGAVRVESEPGKGAAFFLYFPRYPRGEGEPPPQETKTVLLVEDQDLVRRLMGAMLREHGYSVLEAAGGPAALELAERYAEPIHLLVTDALMPEMSGLETARLLRRLRPGLRALIVSGLTQDAALRREAERGLVAFLAKPFAPAELLRAVRASLLAPAPAAEGGDDEDTA